MHHLYTTLSVCPNSEVLLQPQCCASIQERENTATTATESLGHGVIRSTTVDPTYPLPPPTGHRTPLVATDCLPCVDLVRPANELMASRITGNVARKYLRLKVSKQL